MTSITEWKTQAERLVTNAEWYVDDAGCWIWVGKYNGARAKLGAMNAARAMWIAHYGLPHELLEVCHACHNPACVNINHLYLANHTRNMADGGGRGPVLPYANAETVVRKRTLSDNDKMRVRYLNDSRLLLTRELALLFDVTVATIRAAINEGSPS